jgi:diguanylate cyclase (GGDEF)-like protein
MLSMPGAAVDTAQAGRRVRTNVLLALSLSSVIPLLVLAYTIIQYALPRLERPDTAAALALQALLLFTLLGVLAGGWLVWTLGRTVVRMHEMMARDPAGGLLDTRGDDLNALARNLQTMLSTIERQATEINLSAARLDAAYRELESTKARLKETSFRDDLTGLYNRRFFTIRLDEEISRHRRFNHPVSIVLLDLDGFKAVNDDLGHAVGDDTLRDVAQLLMRNSRGINVVSRYGGDEFAVLLVETSKAGARLYAERIRDVIAAFRHAHGKPVTASLGVASLPDDDVVSAENLFKMADEALYAAKRAGKNQVAVAERSVTR